jgi:hypothetical protein
VSAVLIELPADRYWGLTEARRVALGYLAHSYRQATPLRVIAPAGRAFSGWAMPVHAEDETLMRGAVESVASGTTAYYPSEELRAVLPSAGAR